MSDQFHHSILVPGKDYHLAGEMHTWCRERGWRMFVDYTAHWKIGHQYIGHDLHWSFVDPKHALMFSLRWS